MKKLNYLVLVVLFITLSCKRSKNSVIVEGPKYYSEDTQIENEEDTDYKEPNYSRLGYNEIEFTGKGSQVEMNEEEGSNYERALNRMNTVLDSIHILYSKKDVFWEEKKMTSFFKSLEISQKTWLAYCESLVELKYPKDELGGSASMMCETDYRTTLINQRIRDLNPWLMGTPQGEVCGGTQRLLDYSWSAIRRSQEKNKK